ncbi:MAG: hypothetical protein ABIE14_02570 [Patescibacteria group bacterium]
MLKLKVKLATNMVDIKKPPEAPLPESGTKNRGEIDRVFTETPARKLRRLIKEKRGVTALLTFLIQADINQLKKEDIPDEIRWELIKKCGESAKSLNVTPAEIRSPENLSNEKKFAVRQFKKYSAILKFLPSENALEAVKYSRY